MLSARSAVRAAPSAPLQRSARHSGPLVIGAVLLIVGLATAISIDVVRAGFGVKGDEATYVAMTWSLAHDGDLSYQRRDLERFFGLYKQGPEGIFLKRGKQFRVRLRAAPPFVRVLNDTPEPRTDRLFYAKAIVYSVAAAPFVRVLGMNGFLVFHVLLLALVCACGYVFLVATTPPHAAALFVLAFVAASIVPVYAVFLTPEIFNFALVFVAYFLWLYKEVADPRSAFLRGTWSDIAAAVLLGMAAYSKPTNLPLAVPIVLALWWQRRFWRGFLVGLAFAASTGGWFLANALVSGEFNYQGGDRATFYESFPFDGAQQDAWDRRALVTTNDSDADVVLERGELPARFANNVKYFLVGRHFGFVPYFFPGVVVLALWLTSARRFTPWRLLTVGGVVASAVVLLLFLPYSWSGGGGPPGNRYFLSIYPALFFVVPPLSGNAAGLTAWIGGALFTAKILVNPFVSAKSTWEASERGFARRLPVELTMANDLPLRLDGSLRGRIPYGYNPTVFLYFLDRHAFPPEPAGMWIAGDGRAEIIVRSVDPIDHLTVTAVSPIPTVFSMSLGAETIRRTLEPGKGVTFDLPASGVRGLKSYAYLMTAHSSEGFTPRVRDPASRDTRNLAVSVNFTVTSRAAR